MPVAACRWKDSDNVIAERAADGRMMARFVPAKATYYEALSASSVGWADRGADYAPSLTYMMGVSLTFLR